jgi:hypothetical protein
VTINPTGSTASLASYTLLDRTTAALNSVSIVSIGLSSNVAAAFTVKLAKRNSAGNYDVVVSQTLSHGGGGFEDVTLSSPYAVPATGSYYFGGYTDSSTTMSTTAAVNRAYKAGNAGVGAGQAFTENSYQSFAIALQLPHR